MLRFCTGRSQLLCFPLRSLVLAFWLFIVFPTPSPSFSFRRSLEVSLVLSCQPSLFIPRLSPFGDRRVPPLPSARGRRVWRGGCEGRGVCVARRPRRLGSLAPRLGCGFSALRSEEMRCVLVLSHSWVLRVGLRMTQGSRSAPAGWDLESLRRTRLPAPGLFSSPRGVASASPCIQVHPAPWPSPHTQASPEASVGTARAVRPASF